MKVANAPEEPTDTAVNKEERASSTSGVSLDGKLEEDSRRSGQFTTDSAQKKHEIGLVDGTNKAEISLDHTKCAQKAKSPRSSNTGRAVSRKMDTVMETFRGNNSQVEACWCPNLTTPPLKELPQITPTFEAVLDHACKTCRGVCNNLITDIVITSVATSSMGFGFRHVCSLIQVVFKIWTRRLINNYWMRFS